MTRNHRAPFPFTRLSLLEAVRQPELGEAAFATLVEAYWGPVYSYLRLRWRVTPEETEDLVQSFFARVLEKRVFAAYNPEKARFRTFLRLCLDRFVINERTAAMRHKRRGALSAEPQGQSHEVEDSALEPDPEECFHREWLRALFAEAIERLQALCVEEPRRVRFKLFERYDLLSGESVNRLSYADLAAEFGLPVTQVTNHLAWARRELRRLVLEVLRERTVSEREFRDEARRALGMDLP
ncbi:MAG TPA: sigma-70 family RNA polymerase sigma factor [Thermoanaerobaculia bacterium]|nr:sigma-70 family RNA polymerase sigma factor [Thermoanaerobaculia bacterium]